MNESRACVNTGGRNLFVFPILTVSVVFVKPHLYPNLNTMLMNVTMAMKVILTETTLFSHPHHRHQP